ATMITPEQQVFHCCHLRAGCAVQPCRCPVRRWWWIWKGEATGVATTVAMAAGGYGGGYNGSYGGGRGYGGGYNRGFGGGFGGYGR
ncbi:hypothetical protein MRX96_049251, partial [Rhipicephalus microplus]